MMMTTVAGNTQTARLGAIVSTPSTADSTEIAGVITESPKNSDAPMTPSARIHVCLPEKPALTSDISDSVPPSPLLSALVTKKTYLMVTVMVSAQTMSDSSPSTSSASVAAFAPSANAWRNE